MSTDKSIAAQIQTTATDGIKKVSGDEGSVESYSIAEQIAAARFAQRSKKWTPASVLSSIRGGSISPPSARGN